MSETDYLELHAQLAKELSKLIITFATANTGLLPTLETLNLTPIIADASASSAAYTILSLHQQDRPTDPALPIGLPSYNPSQE